MKDEVQPGNQELFVVGLGASAGGLDPLKHLFRSLPEQTGMAFVVVVHLSPGQKSNLAELLQGQTKLKVVQVIERIRLQEDHVYVIPPKKILSVEGDYIEISEPDMKTRRAAVDILFGSLGKAKGENAVAVILSGSGSDGTEGLKEVREHDGFIIAQDPQEADFSDMPENAINSGIVDMVLPVKYIANEFQKYRSAILQRRFTGITGDTEEALQKILSTLHDQTGLDFTNYKQSSVLRRIQRRMHVTRMEALPEYFSYLNHHPDEVNKLLKSLLISVTRFFRDRDAFEYFENKILPQLFEGKDHDSQLRVWVPGCATGEEAYSIAILLHEHAQYSGLENAPAIQVFATDIDEQALKFGRRGKYPESIAANLTPDRLDRYFIKTGDYYQLKQEITEMVLFAHHNLIKDPPFSKLDLISCRNLLIYLKRELQSEVIKLFHYALLSGGWLFLGISESMFESKLFRANESDSGIFKRIPADSHLPNLSDKPIRINRIRNSKSRITKELSLKKRNYDKLQLKLLLNRLSVQSAIINENYEIIHSTVGIHQYLEYDGGVPSLNILEMAKPELRNVLQGLLLDMDEEDSSARPKGKLTFSNKDDKKIEIQIHRIYEYDIPENHFQIVFKEVEQHQSPQEKKDKNDAEEGVIGDMEKELEEARAQIDALVEKNKASRGKMKASNEEFQSMNEELHTTAEELETSLEELQSVNEELKSANQELEIKIEELSRSNSNLKNLMEATEIGVLFVDRDYTVQLFTSSITDIFNLIPADQGRPIDHITHHLRFDTLMDDLAQVLDEHKCIKRMIKSKDSRWYKMQARPYHSAEDGVEGVVLSFIDITQLREAELIIKQQKQQESLATLGLYALERLELDSIMHRASQQVCMILETDYALLYTVDREKKTLQLSAYTGWSMENGEKKEIENDPKWDVGYALTVKEPVTVKNYREEKRFRQSPLVESFDVTCGCHIRIIGSHDVYGVLSIYSEKKLSFTEDDLNYVQIMANLIGMSIERKLSKIKLEETNKQLKKEVRKSERYQREILNTSIAERWQLGSYLHDNLAQILASVKIMLADIHKNVPGSNIDVRESLTALDGIIDEALSSIRDLTHDIIPVDIEEEGVDHAFRFLIKQTQKLHHVNCSLQMDESIGKIKNRKLATSLYHVVQEAIKNAAVHGKAKNIEISIAKSGDILKLEIKDDGFGLVPATREMKGKGLRIMKHRMELLGGTIDIKSRSGSDKQGTLVTCTIPFEDLINREN